MTLKDPKDAMQVIRESGNDFHIRVVEFLRSKGWATTISPYYNDNFSEKPRELDLIAEKLYPVSSHGGHEGWLPVRLFIECKYINTPTVFWFDKKDDSAAAKRIQADTPLDPPERNIMINSHRYMANTQVAKLFASANKQPEGEQIYKALTQSLNALISYKGVLPRLTQNKALGGKMFKTLNYPLIVCSDFELFFQRKGEDALKITESFFLEVDYAFYDKGVNKNEYFLIDMVSFPFLEAFLKGIEESDVAIIAYRLADDERSRKDEATFKNGVSNRRSSAY